jgi:pimeloyl-ACP methyl ester carboxylesterase
VDPQPETSFDLRHWAGLGRSVLNGVVGDRLARSGNPLAIEMGLRPGTSASAPTSRVVVLLHGLTNRESIFRFRGSAAEDYGLRLQRDLGFTPLYLRYNTGLPLEDNGRRFAELLEELIREYPIEVDELALVGFSMGGLVARIAQRVAQERALTWGPRLTRCVYLGTPHEGAPLERLGRSAAALLRRLPGGAGERWADRVDVRSEGIRDLGDGLAGAPGCYLPGARHLFVSGSLTSRGESVVDWILGDGLVTRRSARPEETPEGSAGASFPGVSHFPLAYSEAVYRRIAVHLADETRGADTPVTGDVPLGVEEDSPARLVAGSLDLVGEAVEGVSDAVRDAHLSIAGIPHRVLDRVPGARRVSAPVEAAHRGVASLVYGLVRAGGSLVRVASRLVDER